MQYEKFKNIFNETIFEESKAVLIEKIAKYPNRYIGLFRPTKPKAKILQNLLQSHEIRFGDAFEEAKAKYVAYKTSTNFTDIHLQQSGVKIYLNVKSGQLNDPQGLARDLTKPKPIGHWGNGDYEVKLEKENELETVFTLIKQSYDLNK